MTKLLQDLILRDFWLKLFSFALAVLMWFTISSAIQQEGTPGAPLRLGATRQRTFSKLPIIILSGAGDVGNFKVDPEEVEVTVEGDSRTILDLDPRDMRVLVDLTGIPALPAAHEVRKRVEVTLPAGVTRIKVDPEDVRVVYPPEGALKH